MSNLAIASRINNEVPQRIYEGFAENVSFAYPYPANQSQPNSALVGAIAHNWSQDGLSLSELRDIQRRKGFVLPDSLTSFLDGIGPNTSLENVALGLSALKLHYGDAFWKPYNPENIGPTGYARRLAYYSPHAEALVMTWKAKGESPIHDHSTAGAVEVVLNGRDLCFADHAFEIEGDGLLLTGSKVLSTGDVSITPPGSIHWAGNPTDRTVTTFNIYLPPVACTDMQRYEDRPIRERRLVEDSRQRGLGDSRQEVARASLMQRVRALRSHAISRRFL